MINSDIPIYLASKSPRRRKLLKMLNLEFTSFSVELHEEFLDGEHPEETVKRLAKEKLQAALEKVDNGIIITADTIVVLDHHVLGKPRDERDAERILKLLSGATHTVYTGFAVHSTLKNETIVDYEKTFVKFRTLDEDEIRGYISTGSPMDKAGAYGIQDDFGAVFVQRIEGCYYNVVGLPVSKIYNTLKRVI